MLSFLNVSDDFTYILMRNDKLYFLKQISKTIMNFSKFYDFLKSFMDFNGFRWISMDLHGFAWILIGFTPRQAGQPPAAQPGQPAEPTQPPRSSRNC